MAIEKMTFVDVKGDADYLDETLIRCTRSGVFQPENAARLSEYSIGSASLLRNPYGGLLVKIGEIASELGIGLEYRDGGGVDDSQPSTEGYIEQTHAYLSNLREEYPRYFQEKQSTGDEIASYTAALEMLQHVDAPDIDFDRLWSGKFLKVRFGRLPTAAISRLEVYEGKPYELHKLDQAADYTWCIYITAAEYREDIDAMFHALGFERLRIPDYVHGTATDAISYIQEGLVEERERLQESVDKIEEFVSRERDTFLEVYTRVKFLHDAYDMRRYVVLIRGQFHLVGFVMTKERDRLLGELETIPSLGVEHMSAAADGPLPPPVKLRNNWFVRPFEMFVNMYGSPSYNDIDPSPFVAYTYSILFGMMFGDLGHGLCVFLLGLYLGAKKKMDLGKIMSRIGVASMGFGFAYGSVFGFEHLLDPIFTGVFGLKEKPIHVMSPDTTNLILLAAISVGAAIILMVILFNICVGIKHRDFSRAVLSSNGLAGFVFYASVLFAAASIAAGRPSPLTTPYVVGFIVIPLTLVFLREPITRYIHYRSKDSILHSEDLEESTTFQEGGVNIPELFEAQFVSVRFGRLPVDSYQKLHFYQNEPFMLYPLKTDREYIWCVYAAPDTAKRAIDAVFHDLFFERIFIPEEDMESAQKAEAFIKKCVDTGGASALAGEMTEDQAPPEPKTLYHTLFPEGFGGFLMETFFEMFEVLLSFVSNTMSFLRVGGFILVHAGMMEVVFKLSEMVGGGASPVIIIVGNIFVMGMEGLIVGIQVLRLEFYEIFSRFFDAAGEPFKPYTVTWPDSSR